jgi:hypothetical protein
MSMRTAQIEEAISIIREELLQAGYKHGLTFSSPHEAMSVLREELDVELWEHVCHDTGRSSAACREAAQVAAMAIKYMINFDPRLCVEPALEANGRTKDWNDREDCNTGGPGAA